MVKTKTQFVCQVCGTTSPRWVGKCPNCDSWNSFAEEKEMPAKSERALRLGGEHDEPVRLDDVTAAVEDRVRVDIDEMDRVLGGGLVKGSVTLIGGDPGIGKSTIALQVGCSLAGKGQKVLYISGEESVQQTSMRAKRLSLDEKQSFYIVSQVDVNVIEGYIQKMKPDVVIIDSIQVVYQPELSSTPGSVSQVRECAAFLTQMAKTKGISLFIIGHVTKEGALAGPKVLEHLVDTVLYFEGERYSTYRVLRAIKNRFGSTNELGVFEMTALGLREVKNPSEIFLSERPKDESGSVVVPIVEGTRPFLVEIQGLVSHSAFGMVRHKAQGFDANRLAMLVAVLDKKIGLQIQDKDIFLNIVGGVKVADPAADLAVAMAIASAAMDRPIPFHTVVLGEVGLSSEIRSISQLTARLKEAEKLGFKRCLFPANNLKSRLDFKSESLELIPVSSVRSALDEVREN